MNIRFLSFVVCALSCLVVRAEGLEVVVGDKLRTNPEAEAIEFAANELSHWIGAITDRNVPVLMADEPTRGAEMRLIVGVSAAKELFPADEKAIGRTDGFAVRTLETNGVRNVYLLGTCARGVQNAVYEFLSRNSDIVWYRPNPKIGTIYSKMPAFKVTEADFIDVPKSVFRNWRWGGETGRSPYLHHSAWEARNRMNAMLDCPAKFAPMQANLGRGHGFIRYANPKRNFETHPEWFTFFKGERTPKTGWVCFLAGDALVDEYVANMKKEIEAAFPGVPPKKVKVDFFNLSGADNWEVCECEKCRAPFTCPNGKVLQPDDRAFRSAQCFAFLNAVAKRIRKEYPNVTIGQYAYYITTTPPPFKLEPNIRIQFCPYGEDVKRPISDDGANAYWCKDLDGWGKVCPKTVYRTYMGCNNAYPRQLEYIMQTNCQYCMARPLPMREFTSEVGGDEFMPFRGTWVKPLQWDMNAMEMWLECRIWWNPDVDLEALRRDYVRRVYRTAAEPMMAWHDLMRDAYYSDKMSSIFNGVSSVPYTRHYLVDKGLADKALVLLNEGLAKADHPNTKELIRRQREWLASWIEEAKLRKVTRLEVPYSSAKGLGESFDSDVWQGAAVTEEFVIANRKAKMAGGKAKTKTVARILHDRQNFYVRLDCWADMAKLRPSKLRPGQKESAPRGDVIELYFGNGDTGTYWLMMLDAGNPEDPSLDCIYDAKMSDVTWNGGWTRKVKRYDDRWTAIVTVPFSSIGVTTAQTGRLLFQAIRDKFYVEDLDKYEYKNGEREHSSTNGGWVHDVQGFGELIIK